MAVLYTEDFESTANGSLPSGWVSAVGTWVVGTTEPGAGTKALNNTSNAYKDYARYDTLGSRADMSVQITTRAMAQNYNAICPMARLSNADTSAYVCSLEYGELANTFSLQLYRLNAAGNITLLGSRVDLTGLITSGDFYNIEIRVVGTSIEGRYWAITGNRPSTATVSTVDSTLTAGYPGIYRINALTIGNDNSPRSADGFIVTDAAASATAITMSGPSSGNLNTASSNFTVGANGPITGTIVVTPSSNGGGGTFTPTSVSISSGTPTATFTYTPNSGGTKTISVTNNGGLTNPANISYSVAANYVTDPNVFYSPYNWDLNSGKKITACAGAYLKMAVTGTTSVTFTFDNSGVGNGNIRYQLNGGAFSSAITLSGASPTITISGLTAGVTTQIKLVVDTVALTDRWTGPASAAIITNIDIGAGSLVAPTLKTKRFIWFGDSITEGQATLSGSQGSAVSSSVILAMDSLDAEYGAVGYGFQGYVHTGSGNVPAFNSAYNSYSNARSRLTAGLLSPIPDGAIIWHGANDVPSVGVTLAQSDVTTGITNIRTICGSTTKIYTMIPVGGFNRTTITSAFNAYQAANPSDATAFLLDLGTSLQTGLDGTTGANANSYDGIHPNATRNIDIAAAIVSAVNSAVSVLLAPNFTTTHNFTNTLTVLTASMWDEVIEGPFTARDLMKAMAAVLLAKNSGMDTNTPVFRNLTDDANRVTSTTDANGNRLTVTINRG